MFLLIQRSCIRGPGCAIGTVGEVVVPVLTAEDVIDLASRCGERQRQPNRKAERWPS
jgi:hypothetical protein